MKKRPGLAHLKTVISNKPFFSTDTKADTASYQWLVATGYNLKSKVHSYMRRNKKTVPENCDLCTAPWLCTRFTTNAPGFESSHCLRLGKMDTGSCRTTDIQCVHFHELCH